MIESLAEQWMRGATQLKSLPGFYGMRTAINFSNLDASMRELVIDTDRITEEALALDDPALATNVRATRAYVYVETQWVVSDPKNAHTVMLMTPDSTDPTGIRHTEKPIRGLEGDILANIAQAHARSESASFFVRLFEARERSIAPWAAECITRKRVEVRALEAEPTLEQLADWMEHFVDKLRLALVRVEHIRVPTDVVGGIMDLRSGNIGRTERSPRDASGRTFSSVDLAHWKLTPPNGYQPALHLPLEDKPTKGSDVRSVLTGGYLRAYLATWALTDGYPDNPHGLFEWDPRRVLLDVYGLQPKHTTVRGKKYARAPEGAERELKEHFAAMMETRLESVGDVTPSSPEPLVSFYRDAADSRRVYRHAPLAWIAVSRHFIQVPRAVLHLDTRDVPLAIGVARILRNRARDVLRGAGHHRATLQQLAREAGEDVNASVRDRGARAYYRIIAERLCAVVSGGRLGALHLEGEGPEAVATLTPSTDLATVYSSLAAERPAPSLEAALAERMARPQRTGRPRKHPR